MKVLLLLGSLSLLMLLLILCLASEPLSEGLVLPSNLKRLYLLPLFILLELPVSRCLLFNKLSLHSLLLLFLLLLQRLQVVHLLSEVLGILIVVPLFTNLPISKLSIQLQLDQSLPLEVPLHGKLLLLIVQQCIELHYCVPLVVLNLAGPPHLRESFMEVSHTVLGRDGQDSSRVPALLGRRAMLRRGTERHSIALVSIHIPPYRRHRKSRR